MSKPTASADLHSNRRFVVDSAEMKDKLLRIRVSSEELEQWKQVAGDRGVSQWVRERVYAVLPSTSKPFSIKLTRPQVAENTQDIK